MTCRRDSAGLQSLSIVTVKDVDEGGYDKSANEVKRLLQAEMRKAGLGFDAVTVQQLGQSSVYEVQFRNRSEARQTMKQVRAEALWMAPMVQGTSYQLESAFKKVLQQVPQFENSMLRCYATESPPPAGSTSTGRRRIPG